MKKIEMDMSPLDNAVAEVEETLQSIELNDVYEYDDKLFDSLDFSILESNEEIKQELTGLSTLMGDLQHLLQKELGKVEEVQIKKSMAAALARKQVLTALSEDVNDGSAETIQESAQSGVPLSRKEYRNQDKEDHKKSKMKRGRRRK